MTDWRIYRGATEPHDGIAALPAPPPWRVFDGGPAVSSPLPPADEVVYLIAPDAVELVNAALYLRRPLLVTGRPGTGKSTLAKAIAHELKLGQVLRWPITTRATLRDGLYRYDAIGRLQEAGAARESASDRTVDIGRFLSLGPLGTALLPRERPRVLLVDEIDKSDIDLPNDLLNVFEEGEYEIPELSRIADEQPQVAVATADGTDRVTVERGRVRCRAFPVVVMTSNGEREFPPAFLRRCIRLELPEPDPERLAGIVRAHLGEETAAAGSALIDQFLSRRESGQLATDQLLNAVYLTFHATHGHSDGAAARDRLANLVLHHLSAGE